MLNIPQRNLVRSILSSHSRNLLKIYRDPTLRTTLATNAGLPQQHSLDYGELLVDHLVIVEGGIKDPLSLFTNPKASKPGLNLLRHLLFKVQGGDRENVQALWQSLHIAEQNLIMASN